MCFVFIWEQTATCATYSMNWLVFITEMKSVYSAVRTGSLNKAVCPSFFRTNSDLCHLQHNLIGFCNRDEKCLKRGTDWIFKQSSLRFVFKGLILMNLNRPPLCITYITPLFVNYLADVKLCMNMPEGCLGIDRSTQYTRKGKVPLRRSHEG